MDWGQPYSCSSWAETFGQTFPILDDNNGSSIYGLFGVGYVPHNVVIGGDGQVIFSESGFNQNTMIAMIEEGLENLILDVDEDGVLDSDDNCIDIANPNQADIDFDGAGDACDPCDNQNVYTFGNINGTIDQEGLAIVDIFDVMELVDILLSDDQESCGSEIADLNSDGNQNVVDIIFLVQMLLGGDFESISSYDPGLFEIDNSGIDTRISISNDSKIGGLQFTSSTSASGSKSLPEKATNPAISSSRRGTMWRASIVPWEKPNKTTCSGNKSSSTINASRKAFRSFEAATIPRMLSSSEDPSIQGMGNH